MRALLLLILLVPVADAQTDDTVTVPSALFRQLLGDNLRLRQAVADVAKERDEATEAVKACVLERST